MEDGSSAYIKRLVRPFRLDVWLIILPTRPQKTRQVVDKEVVLGNGQEYAAPGEEDDDDDDDDDDDHPYAVPDMTFTGSGRCASYEKRGTLSATCKPGVFLGYPQEMGSKRSGDYLVADLEVFKQNAKRPSVHQVKRVYCAPSVRDFFPI